jgi:hypothetical protein
MTSTILTTKIDSFRKSLTSVSKFDTMVISNEGKTLTDNKENHRKG